jgi:predicted O-methyltransferase YrrM
MSAPTPNSSFDEIVLAVDDYSLSHLHPAARANHAALEAALTHSRASGLPSISVSPALGKFLALQCTLLGAAHVLEVGTLGGYSAIWMASQNPELQITTFEIDAHHAHVARVNLDRAGKEVSRRVDIRVGPALENLPGLAKEIEADVKPRVDFTFIDANKESNWEYFDWAVRLSRPRAGLVVDNIVRRGRLVLADSGDKNVDGARRAVENVGRDGRVEAVVLQLVGHKNHDGILVATVKPTA